MDEFLVNMGRRIAEQRRRLGPYPGGTGRKSRNGQPKHIDRRIGQESPAPRKHCKAQPCSWHIHRYLLTGQRNAVDYAAIK